MNFTYAEICQHTLRRVSSIGEMEFHRVFGEEMGKWYWKKLHEDFGGDVAEFICYLDENGLAALNLEMKGYLSRLVANRSKAAQP